MKPKLLLIALLTLLLEACSTNEQTLQSPISKDTTLVGGIKSTERTCYSMEDHHIVVLILPVSNKTGDIVMSTEHPKGIGTGRYNLVATRYLVIDNLTPNQAINLKK